MSVRLVFECDGCDAKSEGVDRLRKRFVSVSGRDYGVGQARWENDADDVAPDGWVAADPYTYCTYCPTCWASIQAPGDSTNSSSYATPTSGSTESEDAGGES